MRAADDADSTHTSNKVEDIQRKNFWAHWPKRVRTSESHMGDRTDEVPKLHAWLSRTNENFAPEADYKSRTLLQMQDTDAVGARIGLAGT